MKQSPTQVSRQAAEAQDAGLCACLANGTICSQAVDVVRAVGLCHLHRVGAADGQACVGCQGECQQLPRCALDGCRGVGGVVYCCTFRDFLNSSWLISLKIPFQYLLTLHSSSFIIGK